MIPSGGAKNQADSARCAKTPTEYEIGLYRADLKKKGVVLVENSCHVDCKARVAKCRGTRGDTTKTYICNGGYTCSVDPLSALRPENQIRALRDRRAYLACRRRDLASVACTTDRTQTQDLSRTSRARTRARAVGRTRARARAVGRTRAHAHTRSGAHAHTHAHASGQAHQRQHPPGGRVRPASGRFWLGRGKGTPAFAAHWWALQGLLLRL